MLQVFAATYGASVLTRIDPDQVRARLRTWRNARGLTQEQLADRSGLEVKHIQDLESGRKGFNPTLLTLDALAAALEVDVMQFLFAPEQLLTMLERSIQS